ncbi:MAG: energy-coupling factor transporter ATPase, partial [Ruminococcus sp.]|nr:energy-coupling factor transporter ATPase [Ruminococcus sp.]
INLSIEEGSFVAVLGHNGSGKSTLAKHFNGILLPTSGKVLVDGIDTTDESRIYDIRQTVGMVFQNPDNQIVATIVEEDVAFALENLGVPPDEIRRRVDEALKTVDMYEYRDHAPHQLSGGQKQRVAIAGIIAMRPRCIVMDEPTAMLDPKGRKEVMDTVIKLNKEYGMSVVFITHFMEEAVLADRVAVIDNSRLLLEGTPKEVFKQEDLLRSVGLDIPQITNLAREMKKSGVKVDDSILTLNEFVENITALLGDK